MAEMKHNFQRGRMNKDLDERIVPDGEYREALNIEVSTSEDSNMGSLQTMMGNTIISQIDPYGNKNFKCIGSIQDSRNNKLYWFITGTGCDAVAEYNYITGDVSPVCVDIHAGTNRVLNFSEDFLITGLNIMDGVLYWTDNNSEPKKINIERCKAGTVAFNVHTDFMVKDISINAIPNTYVSSGPIREEHLTIIKKGPPAAPVLEMIDTTIGDEDGDGNIGGAELNTPLLSTPTFLDAATGEFLPSIVINTVTSTDFPPNSFLIIYSLSDTEKRVRVEINTVISASEYNVNILSGNTDIEGIEDLWVKVEQIEPLFQFKFPRFATRYKYEDGEYSPYSPFTEVAFLPGQFDYMPKEGYNLAMANNLRKLAIKNFVYTGSLPEDVIAIDILYKESNSPNVYSVKQVKRLPYTFGSWDTWNADSPTTITNIHTKGYLPITSEMIHATLPANQLLRPWDNVPRKALAQEIIGNRLVYGNYLQNYNLENQFVNPAENNIKVDIDLNYKAKLLGDVSPEEIHAGLLLANNYRPAKSIKTLRTYQAGVVYIDKYGRETPVLSEDTRGGEISSKASVYLPKDTADKRNSLKVMLRNNPPEWATHFKIFLKETSNEYYNLAMDRWYDAEDGNIWLSFPSAERNKVDEETFLILKKEHDVDTFVPDPARYKIIAIENEAPRFIKLQNISMGGLTDSAPTNQVLGVADISTFPYKDGIQIYVEQDAFVAAGWLESLVHQDVSQVYFRIKTGVAITNYYRLKQVSKDPSGYYVLTSSKVFGDDMSITSPDGTFGNRVKNCELQIVKRIPEDRAEFEGRFFVKILKDFTLIEKLGSMGTMTEHFIVKSSMQVQYINPKSNWSLNNWDGYNTGGGNIQKISVDERNNDWYASQGTVGKGKAYWKMAAHHDGNDSSSTGWFIDAVEGFVPFQDTHVKFGHDNSKRMSVINDPRWYLNCTVGALGSLGYHHTGRLPFEDNPTPMLQKALGLNTYKDSFGNTNYLNISGQGVRPPVKPNNDNIVENSSKKDGGEVTPNRGIDGNHIYLSYAGLNAQDGNINSGNGTTNWENLNFGFNLAERHAADILFITKLTQPGALWTWKEDPGQVLYMTKNDPTFANEGVDFDGQRGIAMYNYINFADYWYDGPHHIHSCKWTCFGTPHECNSPQTKDALVSRARKGGYIHSSSGYIEDYFDYDNTWCFNGCCSLQAGWCPESNHDHVWPAAELGGAPEGAHQVWPHGVYDWNSSWNMRRRFIIHAVPLNQDKQEMVGVEIGGVEPHYYKPTNPPDNPPHFYHDGSGYVSTVTDQASGILYPANDPDYYAPGIRADGMHTEYTNPGGTYLWDNGVSSSTNDYSNIPQYKSWDTTTTNVSPAPGSVTWQIKEYFVQDAEDNNFTSTNPAIWETEPKEDVGLDIYYEVGQIYPIELNDSTIEQHVGAIQSDITKNSYVRWRKPLSSGDKFIPLSANKNEDVRVVSGSGSKVALGAWNGIAVDILGFNPNYDVIPTPGSTIRFYRADGGVTEALVIQSPSSANGYNFILHPSVHIGHEITLPWFNCYSFGNGVESDRVRDDYNQVTIDNGPKASTTLEEPYLEERRCTGFIWSGIYNSNSGVNDLNQFIQAEKITKDVNPGYGCIQKMHTRDNDLVAFCEDRVLKVYANKDALYNADGNTNVIATNRVLGAVKPFIGDYGISKNPESFASDSYRSYFSDASRGAVLRLSQDGLTPISDAGMQDWFADVLPEYAKVDDNNIIGSFDDKKQEYNITLIAADYVSPCDTGGDDGSVGNGSGGNGYIAANALGDWGFSSGTEDGQPNAMSWTQFDTSGIVVDNFVNIAVDTVVSIVIPPVDMTSTNQSSEFTDIIDALNTYGAGNILLHYTDSGLGAGGYSSGAVVTYEIVSITINGYGNYVITVVHESGIHIHMVATHFWWSLKSGDEGGNGDNGFSSDTIIQNIEDEIHYTLAYSETSKGWTSFRSYLQESGVSLNNEYYTFKNGELYSHHTNEDRNNFYGNQYDSYVSILLNRAPSVIKSFTTVGYEGSLARITQNKDNPEYYDNTSKDGWYVSNMITNLQEVGNLEFISKEEKYFSQIRGVKTIWTEDGLAGNVDPREFSFQGIGNSNTVTCPECGPTISWNCAGEPCECIKVEGSGGNYPTQLACESDTSGCCGQNESWCFVGDECIDPGDGSGPYSELCDCILENYPCNQGYQWLYDCLGITVPTTFVTGCMDDGITTDPFITQNRPSGWIGPASNYDISANVPDCSCIYQTLPTYDCINGNCVDPGDGSGYYNGINALNDCLTNCIDPCVHQDFSVDFNTVDPTEIEPPCALVASDGSISTIVTNANPGSANPFTSWTVEYYDSIIPTTGPPTIGGLVYSDPNTYGLGVWSNVYVGLTTAQAGTTGYGIYFVKITDNNGCEYGPFSVRINCLGSLADPCENYPHPWSLVYAENPAAGGCCAKCEGIEVNPLHYCYDFCMQWGECCGTSTYTWGSDDCNIANSLGAWDINVGYQAGDVVEYLGQYYISISGTNIGDVPTSISKWALCI